MQGFPRRTIQKGQDPDLQLSHLPHTPANDAGRRPGSVQGEVQHKVPEGGLLAPVSSVVAFPFSPSSLHLFSFLRCRGTRGVPWCLVYRAIA